MPERKIEFAGGLALRSIRYLTAGERMVDPFFGTFKLDFAGISHELQSAAKVPVEMKVQGNDDPTVASIINAIHHRSVRTEDQLHPDSTNLAGFYD